MIYSENRKSTFPDHAQRRFLSARHKRDAVGADVATDIAADDVIRRTAAI
jgi:hypothetical protein